MSIEHTLERIATALEKLAASAAAPAVDPPAPKPEPKAKPKPTETKPTEEPEKAPAALTKADVQQAVKQLVMKCGQEEAVAFLKKFGAANASTVKPEDYERFVSEASIKTAD